MTDTDFYPDFSPQQVSALVELLTASLGSRGEALVEIVRGSTIRPSTVYNWMRLGTSSDAAYCAVSMTIQRLPYILSLQHPCAAAPEIRKRLEDGNNG